MKLKLSDTLALPTDAVTQTFAFLGRRGSGKTYGSGKLAELFLEAGAQIVVLDPIGTWYGLRLSADGKSKGFSVPVFGGEHGDVPLEPQAGALIAKLLVEQHFSAVLDVSAFRKEQRKQFVTDFAEELMHRKKTNRSAMHVFFEEAQLFIPQQVQGKTARMVGAFEDLIKLGRNYGIGASLLSQRPQSVNKDVLNQTEVLLAFQMTGPQERKTIDGWISDKGIDEKLSDILPRLKIGEARLWSPQWLGVSETIHIGKKKTFDASSTPTVGAAIVQPKELSPVDVEKIKTSMADVVKRAEEMDPKKLQAKIRQLEVELAKKPAAEIRTKEIEVPVFPAELEKALRSIDKDLFDVYGKIGELTGRLARVFDEYKTEPAKAFSAVAGVSRSSVLPTPVKSTPTPKSQAAMKLQPAVINGDFRVTSVQQKILDALALCEALGTPQPPRVNVAFLAGYTVNGHFNNVVGSLNTTGLITYPFGGHLALTDSGRAIANASANDVQTLVEFHNLWRSKLPTPEVKILNVLLEYRGDPIGRELLAERTGYTVNGHFNNCVGHLKTLGAAYYPAGGMVAASDVMFPEGLN